jgi:nitric-oxide synthase
LKKQAAGSLHGLNYSVLGIGSTVYEYFCAAGVAVDKALAKAGANCIVPLHKGDEIKGQSNTFKQWLGLVSRVLGEDATSADATAANAPKLNVTFLNDVKTRSFEASLQDSTPVQGDRGVEVPLVANSELLKEVIPGSRSTRYLVFDISGIDLQYETGDHVAVYPCNPPELVNRLCERLGVTSNTYFTAQYITPDGTPIEDKPPVAVPTTINQVLSEELDLALREPFNDLLTYLHSAAQNLQEKHRLETWLEILKQGDDHPDSITLKKTITDNCMSVVDLFDEFPSAEITLAALLELLSKQKPRLYSISSCPLLHPQHIQITVGVLQIKTDAGKVRQGLCSNYLAGLEVGAKVCIGVRTSDFRPPSDPDAPMVMVGPGTGVSPLIAFLQYREALLNQGQPLGNATLYFGCRDRNDFLYQEQLQIWQEKGVLTGLEVAFSRLDDQKVYVQNLMQQKSQDTWKLLSHPQCHYYVCGDAKMADDVFDVMLAIVKTEGGLSHTQAVEFFDKMKKEKRFTSDVWGVQLHFKQAIKQVQHDNYSKAEKWLNRLQQSGSPDTEQPQSPLMTETPSVSTVSPVSPTEQDNGRTRGGGDAEILSNGGCPYHQVSTPVSQPQPTTDEPIPQGSSKPRFSTKLEVLGGAACTGLEAGLLFVALRSLLPSPGLSMGLWGMIVGSLIFAYYRCLVPAKAMAIIAGLTFAAVLLIPALHSGLPMVWAIIIPILAAVLAIALTALFRAVYK